MKALPIGYDQFAAYELFFGEGAVERVHESINRNGELVLTFVMAGQSHAVQIRPAKPRRCR